MKQLKKLIIIALVFIPVLAFAQTNNNYIKIGYSSICCGTPDRQPIIDFVKNFELENKLKPFEMFIEGGLGEEGEYAIYIGTDHLDTQLLKSFWNGLNEVASHQNKFRAQNHDGYVNLEKKIVTNAAMKSKKIKVLTI